MNLIIFLGVVYVLLGIIVLEGMTKAIDGIKEEPPVGFQAFVIVFWLPLWFYSSFQKL
jgi:hypothetical protein